MTTDNTQSASIGPIFKEIPEDIYKAIIDEAEKSYSDEVYMDEFINGATWALTNLPITLLTEERDEVRKQAKENAIAAVGYLARAEKAEKERDDLKTKMEQTIRSSTLPAGFQEEEIKPIQRIPDAADLKNLAARGKM